jgi:hypothetical protein
LPISRFPFRHRPRTRTILVEVPVSSTKISFLGSSPAWPALKLFLASATSGRSRAEKQGVNARIIALHDQEIFLPQENVVFGDDFSFQRGNGYTKHINRAADEGSDLQKNNPVL